MKRTIISIVFVMIINAVNLCAAMQQPRQVLEGEIRVIAPTMEKPQDPKLNLNVSLEELRRMPSQDRAVMTARHWELKFGPIYNDDDTLALPKGYTIGNAPRWAPVGSGDWIYSIHPRDRSKVSTEFDRVLGEVEGMLAAISKEISAAQSERMASVNAILEEWRNKDSKSLDKKAGPKGPARDAWIWEHKIKQYDSPAQVMQLCINACGEKHAAHWSSQHDIEPWVWTQVSGKRGASFASSPEAWDWASENFGEEDAASDNSQYFYILSLTPYVLPIQAAAPVGVAPQAGGTGNVPLPPTANIAPPQSLSPNEQIELERQRVRLEREQIRNQEKLEKLEDRRIRNQLRNDRTVLRNQRYAQRSRNNGGLLGWIFN